MRLVCIAISLIIIVVDPVLAQLSPVFGDGLPPVNNSRICLIKNLWGTNWNTLSISKKYGDRLVFNADYSGWTMHKEASVSSAIVLSLDEHCNGWVELGGKIESFPEVNSVDLKILSSLGALYTGENLSLSGIVQVSDRTIPWVIKSIYREGDGRMVVYAEIIPQFLRMSFERVWAKEEEIGIDTYSYSKCLSISLTHGKHIRH